MEQFDLERDLIDLRDILLDEMCGREIDVPVAQQIIARLKVVYPMMGETFAIIDRRLASNS